MQFRAWGKHWKRETLEKLFTTAQAQSGYFQHPVQTPKAILFNAILKYFISNSKGSNYILKAILDCELIKTNGNKCVGFFELLMVSQIYIITYDVLDPAKCLFCVLIQKCTFVSPSMNAEQHQIITLSISVKKDDLTLLHRGLPANYLAWRESKR